MVTEVKGVREGYKMTELGEIPEGWEVKSLEDLTDIITKGTSPSTYKFEFENNGVNFFKVESLSKSNQIIDSKIAKVSNECHEKLSRSQITSQDILISIAGTLGRICTVDESYLPANTNQALAIVRLANKEMVSFIYYGLQSPHILNSIKNIATTGAQPNLSLKQVGKFQIILPPRLEQQKIAVILSSVDETIEVTDQLLKKTKELKDGLMQKLLTKGIGHTEFKKTEVGEIPVEWELSPLNEVTDYVDYRGKTPKKSESGIFLVTAKNIKKGFIDYSISKEFISEETYEVAMKRGTPKLGEVLFTTEAPLGNVAQVTNENVALAQRVIKFNFKGSSLNKFLMYYMLGDVFQKNLYNKATGTTVKGIQGKQLHKLLIAIPPVEEQKKIIEILTSVDEKIDSYTREIERLQELKKGLMQQILTGKMRVNV